MAPNDDDDPKRFSRRSLFIGVGAAAAAVPVLEACEPAKAPLPAGAVLGPGTVSVTLRVNRVDRPVAVEPRQTLADVLRDELGLTGTKVGCDRGSCSACTVFLSGTPVCACTTFVLDAVGHDVTTIEGVAHGEQLHPVQEEFIAHDAMQCGFCTPGMVMSCVGLLSRKKSVTDAEVRTAVSGNLCRCGTYHDVVAATLAASKRMGG